MAPVFVRPPGVNGRSLIFGAHEPEECDLRSDVEPHAQEVPEPAIDVSRAAVTGVELAGGGAAEQQARLGLSGRAPRAILPRATFLYRPIPPGTEPPCPCAHCSPSSSRSHSR